MRDFDSRVNALYEALKGFQLLTVHYKDGTTRTAKPDEAARLTLQDSRHGGVVKISGGEDAPGHFTEILQAVIDLT